MRNPSVSIRVAACWICVSAIAWSSAASEPEQKETDRVTLPVLVGAVQPAELPEDPSAFTTVIEMEAYRGESKEIAEILGETAGVQVRRFGGRGEASEISIRGSTANQVVILLDGVRINSAQTGGVDISSIPKEMIERIEVSRGGGSVQTGSDAVGGVVNIITKRPSGKARTTASVSAGSFGTWEGSATQTGALKGVEFSLGYSGFTTDGDWDFRPLQIVINDVPIPITDDGPFERVNNDSTRHSALLRAGLDIGDWGRISFDENFYTESGGAPGPAWLSGQLQGQSLTADQRRTRNVASLLFEAAKLSPAKLDTEFRIFHRFDRYRFDAPPAVATPAIDSDDRNHSAGSRLGVKRDLKFGFSEHTISLNGEFRQDWLDAKDQTSRKRRTWGLSVQNEIALWDRAIRLIPALRVDDTQGFETKWIPRVGLIVRPLPWLELKGNIERSYRVPNFDELYFNAGSIRGNPNLLPEDAVNADAGFKIGFDALGPLRDSWLEFAAFHNDIDESIVFQFLINHLEATNTGSATAKGIELAGGFSLWNWVRVSANWTHLDTNQKSTGAPLPGRAEDEYLLRAEIGPASNAFKLVGDISHTSDIPVSSSGNRKLVSDSRNLYGLSFAIDIAQLPKLGNLVPGSELLFSVAAQNLTDISVRDAQAFPRPGRTITFRLEWRS